MNKIIDLAEQNLAQLLLERDVLRADVERLGAIVAQLESKLASLAPPCQSGCRHDHFETRERMRVDHIGRLIEERNNAWKELAQRRAELGSRQ